ncbi:tyrosine-type recombinase/integrase [Nonomuraea sp. NPDC050783]|uniref:tyrosine-type recombinase/integrase n=1 Tax=Nonomuraea sp. NPDC050783 TaxID=3154634 RepID=UPI003467A6DA
MRLWLDERPHWPRAGDNPALFLNAKGGRLTARAAGGIIAEIAQTAGLDDLTTAHVLRNTLATTLVRGKTDLSWSPKSLATLAWRRLAGTACHPTRTRKTPSS